MPRGASPRRSSWLSGSRLQHFCSSMSSRAILPGSFSENTRRRRQSRPSVTGLGMPVFWFGIVLIEVFALRLHAVPVGGWGNGFGRHLQALVLPGLTASFAIVPILVRSLRVGMIEVLDADFVATARAKGIGELRVLLAHVARNALIPTVTLLGVNIAYLIGSTVVVEQVFDLNGLGSLLLHSITDRDFPVVQSVTLVLATSVVLINLLTDLLAATLDPRIRLG